MKECRKCGEYKDLSEYYKHKQMHDGYINICKECTRNRVTAHRWSNIDKAREYDRNRPNYLQRNKNNLEKIRNLSEKDRKEHYSKANLASKLSKSSNNKKVVNQLVSNSIRGNKIIKNTECEHCGVKSKLDAHHENYLEPLNVIWLCRPCHGKRHKQINKEKRDKETT